MAEEWYYINPVGFTRIFITGHNSETNNFELELSPEQILAVEGFNFEQEVREQNFLKELINAG